MEKNIYISLRAISPNAEEFVRHCGADVLWKDSSDQSSSCIITTRTDGLGIVFASIDPPCPEKARFILCKALDDLCTEPDLTERCFNCRGNDQLSRDLAQIMGFKLEMAGYFLTRRNPPEQVPKLSGLRAYQASDQDSWVELSHLSYRKLCQVNGWNTQIIHDPKVFGQDMLQRVTRNEAWSYLEQSKLIGGYRLNGSFIEDILVLPEHQNRGLGSQLLEYAVARVMQNGFAEVNLRVAESNTAALRLYQRRQFVLVSHFAEHCY